MVTECVAILAISLCLVVVFIRAGHGDYAASVTPILGPGRSPAGALSVSSGSSRISKIRFMPANVA